MATESGPCKINGQTYMRPVIRVASIRLDGGAACVVPVGELLSVIGEGHEYTVRIKMIPVREYEALPEFSGW